MKSAFALQYKTTIPQMVSFNFYLIGAVILLSLSDLSMAKDYVSEKRELGANPTKSQFRSILQSSLQQNSDISENPMKRDFYVCVTNKIVDYTYQDANVLQKGIVESRLEKIYSDKSLMNLIAMKCVGESKEIENQVLKNSQNRLPLMDLDDLRVDLQSLNGKRVRTNGVGHYVLNSFILKKSNTDTNIIFIDIESLPREERREIVTRCSNITETCQISITGIVRSTGYRIGLVAEKIEW